MMNTKKQTPRNITAIERLYLDNDIQPDKWVIKTKGELFEELQNVIPEVPWAIENALFGYYHTVSMQAFKKGFILGMKIAQEAQDND